MDAHEIVSAFVGTANQHALEPSESSLKQFQRHLEILVCLTSETVTYFQDGPYAAQCITHLTSLLLDQRVSIQFLSRALTVIQNLAGDPSILPSLQISTSLLSALGALLYSRKDAVAQQCLSLIDVVTTGLKLNNADHSVQRLVDLILGHALTNCDLNRNALHILSNLCHATTDVNKYISNLSTAKQMVKKLVLRLNSPEPDIVLYTLSILSSLAPYEKVWDDPSKNTITSKLWTEDHLRTAFEMAARKLFSKDNSCVTTSANLLYDLLSREQFRNVIKKSSDLSKCFRKLCKALLQVSEYRACTYLKLLSFAINVSDISEPVCSSFPLIYPTLLQWGAHVANNNTPTERQILSLHLISCFLSLNASLPESKVNEIAEGVLKNILALNKNTLSPSFVEVILKSFEILLVLLVFPSVEKLTEQQLTSSLLKSIVHSILTHITSCENEVNLTLFFTVIEVIIFLKHIEVLDTILSNRKTISFISSALASSNSKLVRRCVSLLSSTPIKSHLDLLSESISLSNQSSHVCQINDIPIRSMDSKSLESLLERMEKGLNLKSSEIMDLYEYRLAVQANRERELQGSLEAKCAALMDADRAIASYKCREGATEAEAAKLRNLLAESQRRYEVTSEKLILTSQDLAQTRKSHEASQIKVRDLEQEAAELSKASRAEADRLRHCAQEEAARLCEQLQYREQEKKTLVQQLQRLEEDFKQKSRLAENLQEEKTEALRQLDETKKAADRMRCQKEAELEEAQKAIAQLEEQNASLEENLQQTTGRLERQLMEQESDAQREIRVRDAKLEELGESLRKAQETLLKTEVQLHETESQLKETDNILEQTETQRGKLQQDKTILELLCKKYEGSLEEKDVQLEQLQQTFGNKEADYAKEATQLREELKNYEYITGMIRNLTNGNIQPSTEKSLKESF